MLALTRVHASTAREKCFLSTPPLKTPPWHQVLLTIAAGFMFTKACPTPKILHLFMGITLENHDYTLISSKQINPIHSVLLQSKMHSYLYVFINSIPTEACSFLQRWPSFGFSKPSLSTFHDLPLCARKPRNASLSSAICTKERSSVTEVVHSKICCDGRRYAVCVRLYRVIYTQTNNNFFSTLRRSSHGVVFDVPASFGIYLIAGR